MKVTSSKKSNSKKTKKKTEKCVNNDCMNPVRKSLIADYKKNYGQFEMIDKVKNNLQSASDVNYLYGDSYNRKIAFYTFAYTLNFDLTNTICTTFKLRDLDANEDAIYAFVYYERGVRGKSGGVDINIKYYTQRKSPTNIIVRLFLYIYLYC